MAVSSVKIMSVRLWPKIASRQGSLGVRLRENRRPNSMSQRRNPT